MRLGQSAASTAERRPIWGGKHGAEKADENAGAGIDDALKGEDRNIGIAKEDAQKGEKKGIARHPFGNKERPAIYGEKGTYPVT